MARSGGPPRPVSVELTTADQLADQEPDALDGDVYGLVPDQNGSYESAAADQSGRLQELLAA